MQTRTYFLSRDEVFDLLDAAIGAGAERTMLSRRLARLIVHRDTGDGWPLVLAGPIEGDRGVCAKALTSRDCPHGHSWLDTGLPLGEGLGALHLPFGPHVVSGEAEAESPIDAAIRDAGYDTLVVTYDWPESVAEAPDVWAGTPMV